MINNGSESRKELLDTVLDYSFDQEKVELYVHSHFWLMYCCVSYPIYSSCLMMSTLDYVLQGDPCGHARMGPHTSRATELGIEHIGVKRSRLDEGPDSDRQRRPPEDVCNFKANRKTPRVKIVANFACFFLFNFTEFELTHQSVVRDFRL